MKFDKLLNINDVARQAKKTLPAPIFDYLERGSDDEYSLNNNTKAYDQLQLVTKALVDVSKIDPSTSLLGKKLALPVILSPTGFSQMYHPEGELAVSRAAASSGTMYSLSTFSNYSIEDVAEACTGPKMFQMYVLTDKGLNRELIERCKTATYDALCLTVDTIVGGNREAIIRSGMSMPPKPTLKSMMQIAAKPGWIINYAKCGGFAFGNIESSPAAANRGNKSLQEYLGGLLETKLTWQHAEDMIDQWGKPFTIKGIMSVEDAKRAAEIGASAIMVSNHGGRQLDCTPSSAELIADIRDAVGDKLEIIADGGIRRGTDVIKALAMGANACSMGRPYLYGLTIAGQAGVERTLQILREEIERNMTLLGTPSINDIDPTCIRYSGFSLR
jgi:L-lactate dehydrogenase (cytochrome)